MIFVEPSRVEARGQNPQIFSSKEGLVGNGILFPQGTPVGLEVVMIAGCGREVPRPVVKLAHSARCALPGQWITSVHVGSGHARRDTREWIARVIESTSVRIWEPDHAD